MDEQTRFQTRMHQTRYNSIDKKLKEITNTLNNRTALQEENVELDFSIEELESIIKSFRVDIKYIRKMHSMIICGTMMILLIMSIFVPLSIKYAEYMPATIIMVFFLCMVVVLLLILWRDISVKEKALEKRIELMRDSLWNIHFELYQNQICRLYKIDRNCD